MEISLLLTHFENKNWKKHFYVFCMDIIKL